jgi:uncharacterized membrane protein
MDYLALKFLHILGLILLSTGLIAAFFTDRRARRSLSVFAIAEACRYERQFGLSLVIPGALLLGLSGTLLVLTLDIGFFSAPWIAGMWLLFVFEFFEGNTITFSHARRRLSLAEDAESKGHITPELRQELGRKLAAFTRFLDFTLGALMISLGVFRPSSWSFFAVGIALSVGAALLLTAWLANRASNLTIELEQSP